MVSVASFFWSEPNEFLYVFEVMVPVDLLPVCSDVNQPVSALEDHVFNVFAFLMIAEALSEDWYEAPNVSSLLSLDRPFIFPGISVWS